MPRADRPLRDEVEDGGGEFEQPHGIRDGGPALAHAVGHLILRHAVGGHETLVGVGLLQRVEVAPLHILDERQQVGLCVGRLVHHDGYLGEPSQLA